MFLTKIHRTRIAPLAVLLVSLASGACGQQAEPPIGPPASTANATAAGAPVPVLKTTREPRYEVRPGDVLQLDFAFAAQFNQTVAIQPDGFIALRELGEQYVQGKTVAQVTAIVAAAYKDILQHPVVTVVLKEFEKPHFIVGGQVTRPGKYELRADTTAMEAVAIAGGLTPAAKSSQLLLFRRVSDDWVEVKKFDLKRLQGGDTREDVHLHPGDMLFVPQNTISKLKSLLPSSSVGAYVAPNPF